MPEENKTLTDMLGRQITAFTGIEKALLANVTEITNSNKALSQSQEQLTAILKRVSGFEDSIKALQGTIQQAFSSRRGKKPDGSEKSPFSAASLPALVRLISRRTRVNPFYTAQSPNVKPSASAAVASVANAAARQQPATATAAVAKTGPMPGEAAPGWEGLSPEELDGKKAGEQAGKDVGKSMSGTIGKYLNMSGVTKTLIEGTAGVIQAFNPLKTLFSGVIQDELEYMMNINQIAYVTEGITGDMEVLQGQFSKIEKTTNRTGISLSKFQKLQVKNLQAGMRDRKLSQELLKSSSNAASILGMDAEETGDSFRRWNMELGMSQGQLSQMNLNVRGVARDTGVTGKNLQGAIKSAEDLMKKMRSAGTLTAGASKSVMGMMASAEKFGVKDQVATLMNATVGLSEFMQADAKTKNMLIKLAGGNVSKIYSGQFLKSAESIKSARGNLDAIAKSVGSSMEEIKSGTLTGEKYMRVQKALVDAYGTGVGEMEQLDKTLEEQGMTYIERLQKINKELENQNLTEKERLKISKQRQDLVFSNTSSILTQIAEAGKGTNNFADATKMAIKKFGPEFEQQLKDVGFNAAKPLESLSKAGMDMAKALKEKGGKDGKDFSDEIQKAIESGNKKQIQDVMDKMLEEEQKLALKEKTEADPISAMTQKMLEANEKIRENTGDLVKKWSGWLTWIGTIGGAMTTIIGLLTMINIQLGGGKLFGAIFSFFRGPFVKILGGLFTGIWSRLGTIFGNLFKGAGFLKKIPGISMIFNAIEMVRALFNGEWFKALMHGLAMLANLIPGVGWIISAGLTLLAEFFTWDQIKKFFAPVFDGIASAWNYLTSGFWTDIGNAWNKFWGDIGKSWDDFWSGMGKDWDNFWANLGKSWDDFWANLGKSWDEFWVGVGEVWTDFKNAASTFFTDLWETVVDGFWKSIDYIGKKIDDILGAINPANWFGGIAESSWNPINWFDKGTPKIEKEGLAYVHKGEMIVPADMQTAQGSVGLSEKDFTKSIGMTDTKDTKKASVDPDLFSRVEPSKDPMQKVATLLESFVNMFTANIDQTKSSNTSLLSGVTDGLSSVTNGIGSFIGSATKGFGNIIGNIFGINSKQTSEASEISLDILTTLSTFTTVFTTHSEEMLKTLKSIDMTLITQPANKIVEEAIAKNETAPKKFEIPGLENIMSMFGVSKTQYDALVEAITKVEQPETPKAEMQTLPLADVYDRMMREQASTEAKPSAPELSGIEENTSLQVNYLMQIAKGIGALLTAVQYRPSSMAGNTDGIAAGATSDNIRPAGASLTGKWQQSLLNHQTRAVVNDGK